MNLIELRNQLMNELNAGVFDEISWRATNLLAMDMGQFCMAAQLQRYIDHYSQEWG